ncbi:MAG: YidC/Oxa1 family membrane protein insertase [Candidatus Eremiobacteraeota bacterium]|nr:YidC/Oxa1 family membrane protein insertase [Candidatus Eremiobacteraeota bacterium]
MLESVGQILISFMDFIYQYTGNYGWAIVILAATIKLILYLPTQSQYKSMKEMQRVQPLIKKLQEKFKDNPQKMQAEQMKLFKEHGVNPLGGCLPILIQMPILWGIFITIRKMAEMGKFGNETFLWIGGPLSKIYPEWIAGSLADKDLPLVLMYGFSMYLSQKLTVSDPSAEKTQRMMSIVMPVAFTFILWRFPSALILYWLMFNIFSIIQQVIVMKQDDKKTLATLDEEIEEDEQVEEEDESDEDQDKAGKSRSRSRKKKEENTK